jgi:nitroreductase
MDNNMDNNDFTTIATTIQNRRTVKAFMMNGHKAPNGHIASLLELADWAPTHGYTEPWRFVVYEEPAVFCAAHAELYKANTPTGDFVEGVYTNLKSQGDKASHIIVAIMKRGSLPKIPAFEEEAAVACAIQNLLLGATALNMASFWSTGGMALKPAMKTYFDLGEEDRVMGILYLGYADELPAGKRTVSLEEKITWIK